MKQVDRIADCDVLLQDLDAMILEGKLRDANRQLLQAFNRNEKLATHSPTRATRSCPSRKRWTNSARPRPPTASTCLSMRTAP
jgi:hypothetical protein